LSKTGFNSSNLGARDFLSKESSRSIFSDLALIWVCSTPELQVKCVKKTLEFTKVKILIEKPVSLEPKINSEIRGLIEVNDNVFISRPWSFSNLWESFLTDLVSQGNIIDIEINHFGEVMRDFIAPPQDWLHHDLCLLEEIINLREYQNINFQIAWSSNRDAIKIVGTGDVSIQINGGFSNNRKSSISISFENKTRLVLDLNEKMYSKVGINGDIETFKFETKDSITAMVDHFINLNVSSDDRVKELSLLNRLQLLSI
jgi:hypothetical protein